VLPGPPNTTGVPTLVVRDRIRRQAPNDWRATESGALPAIRAEHGSQRHDERSSSSGRPQTRPRRFGSSATRCPRPIRRWPSTCRRWSRRWRSHFCRAVSGRCCLEYPAGLDCCSRWSVLYARWPLPLAAAPPRSASVRALGATGAAVIRVVLGDWAWLVLTGICVGLSGGLVHHAPAGAVSRRWAERHRPGQLRRERRSCSRR
jgi:hypothetical protein